MYKKNLKDYKKFKNEVHMKKKKRKKQKESPCLFQG